MKIIDWDIRGMRFVSYICGVMSKDMRWAIVAALLTVAMELRHIWDKGEKSNDES